MEGFRFSVFHSVIYLITYCFKRFGSFLVHREKWFKAGTYLLGHGDIHSSLVWKASPEHVLPSAVGVGLAHVLLLLTTEPPQGFSHSDH